MKNRDVWLRLFALLLIGLAAGPEFGLALEMTTLLEILGAVAFFFAFSIGVRLLLIQLALALRDYLLPPILYSINIPAAVIYLTSRVAILAAFIFVSRAFLLAAFTAGWP